MTPDLTLLVWTVALTVVQMLVATAGASTQVGLVPLVGNRDPQPALGGWVGRAQRAHRNMLENLPLFIALILAAHLANTLTPMVMLGAKVFFWARLAYAVIYLAGIPWLRTLAWTVSVIGLLLIFLQLV
jgi:uncharacterized MAPEG superfamily protein